MFGPRTSAGLEPPQAAVPVTGVPGGPGFVEPDVHVLDRLHVLYKYRKVMISVSLLVLVAGVVQTYTTTAEFMSTAQVRAEPEASNISAIASAQQAMFPDTEYFMQTEKSVLGSRDLQRRVVRKLKLTENPEFNGQDAPSGLNAALSSVRARVTKPFQALFNHTPAAPLAPVAAPDASGPALQLGQGQPVPPSPEQVETPAETAAINAFGTRLQIDSAATTHLFTVQFSSRSAQMAADAANAMATEYVAQNLVLKQKKVVDQLALMDTTLNELNAKIDADKANYLDKGVQDRLLDPDQVAKNVATAQGLWQDKLAALQTSKDRYDDLAKLDVDKDLPGALTHPDIRANGVVSQLRSQLQLYIIQLKDLTDTGGLGSANAQVKRVTNFVDDTTKQIKVEILNQIQAAKNDYNRRAAEEKNARIQLDEQKKFQIDNGHTGISYGTLKQSIASQEKIRDSMLEQQKQEQIMQKGIENNTRMVEFAQPAGGPYKPDTSRNVLISLAVGIALALMLAFGLDYLDDTIKTPEDITRKLHVPFLGLVPAVGGDRQPVLSGPVPHDFGEAYRALRTSLVFTSGGETTRIITVTSAQPLEGKTTTACNLAMVLAFGGSRVLLIDADMRRPGVHKALKMVNTVGLSHLLVGQARVREAIQRTSDPNFCVMTAGRTPPNPSELLASERMKQLIANLKQGPFDWVVIDTPPVLAVTDAVILTPLVDGVTFVLGAEMTRRRLAERAVQMLMGSRPKVVGAVLNRVNFDRNKYYYSRYYGYQYKSYYGTSSSGTSTAAKV